MATNPQAPFPSPSQPQSAPPAPGGVYGSPHTPPPATADTPRTPRNGLQVATLIVAALALVVGLAGVVISAIALGRSDKATTLAATANERPLPAATTAPATQAPPATGPASDPATDAPTEPGASTTPGDISPTAEFVVKYQSQNLRVSSRNCSAGYRTGIDLDEPRVLRGSEGDITYGGCRPGAIETTLPLAEIAGQNATPADCLENIRTAPGQSPIAPADGLSLCFLTSQNDAAAQGITQKIVFVTVDSVTENNEHGVLNITLKAWDVPE